MCDSVGASQARCARARRRGRRHSQQSHVGPGPRRNRRAAARRRASLSSATPFLNSKGPQYSASYGGFEAGVDLWRQTSRDGARDAAGLFIGYLAAFADVDQVYSSARAGTVTMNAYSGGAYWTHFAPEGWYIDSVLQGTWFGQAHGGTNATGMSVSGLGADGVDRGGRSLPRRSDVDDRAPGASDLPICGLGLRPGRLRPDQLRRHG